MNNERVSTVVPFPARLSTAALVLTGVVLLAMAWSGVDSYRSIATIHPRDLRIQELCGAIVHLDEVLTMSARLAAATGDSTWERRYRRFEPQLDAAIKESVELTAHSESARAAAQTSIANLKLVEMENESFAFVRAGQAAQAKSVLFSDAYETQKAIYAEGMLTLVQQMKTGLTEHQHRKQQEALLAIIAVAVCIILLLFTWLSVLRKVSHWRTTQSASLDALTRAKKALRTLNEGLEKRVGERTRSLQLEIRERKDAEAALRGSDEKFHQLADNITDVFWIGSPDLTEIHYVSPAYERTWGRSTESLYVNPQQWADAIVPEDRERVLTAFATLTGAERSVSIEYRIARPDGEIRWIHVRGFQVRDVSEEVIRLTGIVTDISDRKRSEAELAKAQADLLETSRRAGMAEVATGVLHNVGNVLSSVKVASSCLADSLRSSKAGNLSKVVTMLREHESDLGTFFTSDSKGKQLPVYLGQLADHLASEQSAALKELAQLQRNIEHIRDIVTMQQGSAMASRAIESVNVAELVDDALRMNQGETARHAIEVIKDVPDLPLVTVEKHKVLQILVNLLRNAKQACDASGLRERTVTIRTTRGEDRIRIAVCDSGVGILPENLIRIFSYGFTTKKDGHGFGLHSAAIAALEMGGSLTVHSDGPGRGAAFTLELPCSTQESCHQ